MDPRHGRSHAFKVRSFGPFGRLTQPIIPVHLRRSSAHPWSMTIEALVDTGAALTLISHELCALIPGLDPSALGTRLPWNTASQTTEFCRPVTLDLLLGPATDSNALPLLQRPVYVTESSLLAPILLGQRGVLDALQLTHSNLGPKPYFRFVRPA